MCFSATTGCRFVKSNNVGRDFRPDFQGFGPEKMLVVPNRPQK